MALSGNESPETGHKMTAHAELKFVPSGTPIAVSFTLKEKYPDERVEIGGASR